MNEGRSKSENFPPSPRSSRQPKAGCFSGSRVEAQTQSVTAGPWLPGPVLLGGLSQLPREASLLIPEGEVGELTPAWRGARLGLRVVLRRAGRLWSSVFGCALSAQGLPSTPRFELFSHLLNQKLTISPSL